MSQSCEGALILQELRMETRSLVCVYYRLKRNTTPCSGLFSPFYRPSICHLLSSQHSCQAGYPRNPAAAAAAAAAAGVCPVEASKTMPQSTLCCGLPGPCLLQPSSAAVPQTAAAPPFHRRLNWSPSPSSLVCPFWFPQSDGQLPAGYTICGADCVTLTESSADVLCAMLLLLDCTCYAAGGVL